MATILLQGQRTNQGKALYENTWAKNNRPVLGKFVEQGNSKERSEKRYSGKEAFKPRGQSVKLRVSKD